MKKLTKKEIVILQELIDQKTYNWQSLYKYNIFKQTLKETLESLGYNPNEIKCSLTFYSK